MSDEAVGEAPDTARLHALWCAAWWPVAQAVTATGHDVLVADPETDELGDWWDGNPNHGAIRVVPHPGLAWVITVVECEPDTESEP